MGFPLNEKDVEYYIAIYHLNKTKYVGPYKAGEIVNYHINIGTINF